jgi:ABC-type uncharacterized transport system substrate-binding protein
VKRLHELGWTEGRTVAIEYRSAEGRTERLSEIADEFVQLKVDVIVTTGVLAVAAAKQAASVIPIVFPLAQDPISSGLVANLARPGGNVTGLSLQQADLAGKRIELLSEVLPVSAGWRSWAMSVTLQLKSELLRPRPARSALRSSHQKSGEQRISHLPSR